MKKYFAALAIVGLLAGNGFAYGGRGHRMVGAIANRRLAKAQNDTVNKKLKKLLDGMTLEEVATLPDNIKDWDPKKDDPNNPPREPFSVKGHPLIEAQLRAFVNADPTSAKPSHHEFHYTDVSVFAGEKYGDGTIGRAKFDIVQMIPFCIRVLQGKIPEKNKHAITKTVAVILLAHYLGDIHQPLHVGGEFFDGNGKAFQPTQGNAGFGDQGGNLLSFSRYLNGKLTPYTYSPGRDAPPRPGNLHGYWDSQTVNNAFGSTQDAQSADTLALLEPANWKLNSPLENWAELLANEILPIAREAHTRLEFKSIKIDPSATDIVSGDALEKKKSGTTYEQWAADTAKNEIQKAGWRLAALLEEALK